MASNESQEQYSIARLLTTLQPPIYYLPIELLSEIFLISVNQPGVNQTTLQRVCQTWRSRCQPMGCTSSGHLDRKTKGRRSNSSWSSLPGSNYRPCNGRCSFCPFRKPLCCPHTRLDSICFQVKQAFLPATLISTLILCSKISSLFLSTPLIVSM